MLSVLIYLSVALLHVTFGSAQHLIAASKHTSLRPRAVDLRPRIDRHTLLYAEDVSSRYAPPEYAAQVSLEPKLPTVVLEDWVAEFEAIACTKDQMLLVLEDQALFEEVEQAWKPYNEFVVITSASGCAADGHHAAYVSSLGSSDSIQRSLLLDIVPRDLQDVSHRLRVDYGSHHAQSLAPSLVVRQLSSMGSTTSVTARPSITATSAPASAAPSVSTSISYPEPKKVSNSTTASDSFDFSGVDTTLLPPDPLIAALVPKLDVPGLKLRCINCTASGSVTITAATFNVHDSDTSLGQLEDFFTDDGYLSLAVNQMRARIEMGLELLPGFPFVSVSAALPDIPIQGITIAGVIKLGLFLSPIFPASIRLNSELRMSTGFTLAVPDASTITLNMTKPFGVWSKGFDRTELRALPFNLSHGDLSFNFTTSFQPMLKLSAAAAAGSRASAQGGIGVAMDLPFYNAEVKKIRNVSNTCDPATDNSGAEYINVLPSVGIDAKAIAELGINYMSFNRSIGVVQPIFEVRKPLPTACYLWSSQSGGLVVASATSSPTGTASGPGRISYSVAMVTIVAALFSLLA